MSSSLLRLLSLLQDSSVAIAKGHTGIGLRSVYLLTQKFSPTLLEGTLGRKSHSPFISPESLQLQGMSK